MKNKLLIAGILAFVLVWGMTLVGCDNDLLNTGGGNDGTGTGTGTGTGNGNGSGNGSGSGVGNFEDLPLPVSSGVNAVSGKTYYEGGSRTVFSASGTYSRGTIVYDYFEVDYGDGVRHESEPVLENGKYTYSDSQIGAYSWNEGAKTVTLKPEKLLYDGVWQDKSAIRKLQQDMYDSYIKEMGIGEAELNQQLSSIGFSSITDYVNYMVNEEFSNKTYGYSFSTDGTALFLDRSLPANKGVNEFSGQTYYGVTLIWDEGKVKRGKDENQKYVFTASGYTYIYTRDLSIYDDEWNPSIQTITETTTGSYAYDSRLKRVWLRPEKIDGKNKAAYYAELTVYSGHHYVDDNAYRAEETNSAFDFWATPYNSSNKTIGLWED